MRQEAFVFGTMGGARGVMRHLLKEPLEVGHWCQDFDEVLTLFEEYARVRDSGRPVHERE